LIFKTPSIAVAGLLVALLGLAVSKPDTARVLRTRRIQAPPEKIFPLIHDLHSWGSWSPYEKLDPTVKKTHSGAASGKGAVYSRKATVKWARGAWRSLIDLHFSRSPSNWISSGRSEGHNVAEFTLEAEGDSTNLTWAMQGPNP